MNTWFVGLNLSNRAKGWENIFKAFSSVLFLRNERYFMFDNNMFFKVLYHFARCPFVIQTKMHAYPSELGRRNPEDG
jgi:hypothetical protein